MDTYDVIWSKAYFSHGSVEIEANSKAEAEEIVHDQIGNYEGSLDYHPEENYVSATKIDRNNPIIMLYPSKETEEN